MKFDMGATTLSTLNSQTDTAGGDLTLLINQLVNAADPLQGNFNGAGRAAFDSFKANADAISAELNGALTTIRDGQTAMDRSFVTGDLEMKDHADASEGKAHFDTARFSALR